MGPSQAAPKYIHDPLSEVYGHLYPLHTVTQGIETDDALIQEGSDDGPQFMEPPKKYVKTRAGQKAVLTCIVKNLKNRQVSFIF